MKATDKRPRRRFSRETLDTLNAFEAIRIITTQDNSAAPVEGYAVTFYDEDAASPSFGLEMEYKIYYDAKRTNLAYSERVKRDNVNRVVQKDCVFYKNGESTPYSHIRSSQYVYGTHGIVTCKHEELLK